MGKQSHSKHKNPQHCPVFPLVYILTLNTFPSSIIIFKKVKERERESYKKEREKRGREKR